MTYKVPFDIIDAILNNLMHESNWETIWSLCQTCKNLVEPCQKQLFNTVAIHHTMISQLNPLLAEHPNLVVYVLHLHYYMDRDSVTCGDIFLLQRFSELQSLHLTGNATKGGIVWTEISVDLQNELMQLLNSSRLQSLSLTYICSWPISLIRLCTNLCQLEIGALGLNDTNMTAFTATPFPPACQPRKLSIGTSAFYALDHLLTATWLDGNPIVDLSLITILHDHSIHAPIEKLRSLHSPVYSIWNGWIPSSIPRIPYGTLLGEFSAIFHFIPTMDSMDYSRWIPLIP